MVYDDARARVVMFGGRAGNRVFGDTWTWDGQHWTQVADIGPAPRSAHAMAFDGRRTRIVLFGGRTEDALAGDTWEWDGETWTQISNTGPHARAEHSLAFLPGRDRVTLFGGVAASNVLLGDTWEWDGHEWTQQEDTGPAPRRLHAATVDDVRRRLIVMGGLGGSPEEELADTWEWNGTAWVQEAGFGPGPIFAAAMAPGRRRVFLFGGAHRSPGDAVPAPMALTWEWAGRFWTLRQDIGPSRRAGHAMTFDRGRAQVVLFGGATEIAPASMAALGDTWTLPEPNPVATGLWLEATPLAPAPFAIAVTPGTARVSDTVTVHLTTAPLMVSQALMLTCSVPDLGRTLLKPVSVPAAVTDFDITVPMDVLRDRLGSQFPLPVDVTIELLADDRSGQAALLRLLPG